MSKRELGLALASRYVPSLLKDELASLVFWMLAGTSVVVTAIVFLLVHLHRKRAGRTTDHPPAGSARDGVSTIFAVALGVGGVLIGLFLSNFNPFGGGGVGASFLFFVLFLQERQRAEFWRREYERSRVR